MLLVVSRSIYWVLPVVAASALARRLLEVDVVLFSKKRAKSGWRRERKMIWAPLFQIVSTRCCELVEDRSSLPSLGKCHPEDEHKLEDVVEGEPVDGVDSSCTQYLSNFFSAPFIAGNISYRGTCKIQS